MYFSRIEELEEEHSQLKREYREKYREHEQLKRLCTKLKDDLAVTKAELEERDRLITEKNLVIVGEEVPPLDDGTILPPKKALVSVENAQLLESAGDGSLGKVLTYMFLFNYSSTSCLLYLYLCALWSNK